MKFLKDRIVVTLLVSLRKDMNAEIGRHTWMDILFLALSLPHI